MILNSSCFWWENVFDIFRADHFSIHLSNKVSYVCSILSYVRKKLRFPCSRREKKKMILRCTCPLRAVHESTPANGAPAIFSFLERRSPTHRRTRSSLASVTGSRLFSPPLLSWPLSTPRSLSSPSVRPAPAAAAAHTSGAQAMPPTTPAELDALQAQLQQRLLESGEWDRCVSPSLSHMLMPTTNTNAGLNSLSRPS